MKVIVPDGPPFVVAKCAVNPAGSPVTATVGAPDGELMLTVTLAVVPSCGATALLLPSVTDGACAVVPDEEGLFALHAASARTNPLARRCKPKLPGNQALFKWISNPSLPNHPVNLPGHMPSGRLHEHYPEDRLRVVRRPYGAPSPFVAGFPALKRWAS